MEEPLSPAAHNLPLAYFALAKPGIVAGNLLPAAAAFLFQAPSPFPVAPFLLFLIALALVIGSACAYNNVIDREIDRQMERTRDRPLPANRLTPSQALAAAFLLAVIGFSLLSLLSPSAAAIALFGHLGYTLLYSRLKPLTPYATLIGAIPGAAPPVVGYAAAGGSLDSTALLLFLLLFLWQMPHFYAIALFRQHDYAAAQIPVWPERFGPRSTQRQIALFSLLFTAALAPLFSLVSLAALVPLAAALYTLFLSLQGLAFPQAPLVPWSRRLFRSSLLLLLALSASLAIRPI
jgi:protoheme IX farnesyltransferase